MLQKPSASVQKLLFFNFYVKCVVVNFLINHEFLPPPVQMDTGCFQINFQVERAAPVAQLGILGGTHLGGGSCSSLLCFFNTIISIWEAPFFSVDLFIGIGIMKKCISEAG